MATPSPGTLRTCWPRGVAAARLAAGVGLIAMALVATASEVGSVPARGPSLASSDGTRAPQVLLVGRWHGIQGTYRSVQAAVNAAHPGDWVLVGPGDYHEKGTRRAGVLITTPHIHLRGMDRGRVIIDGTAPGRSGGLPHRQGAPVLRPSRQGRPPSWTKRRRGLRNERRVRGEPHRVQLPGEQVGREREPDLVQRGRRQRRATSRVLHRSLPQRDLLLRRTTEPGHGAVRDLCVEHLRPRHHRPLVREQHGRLRLLHRGVPRLQHDPDPRARGEQRPGIFGNELGRPPPDRTERVRPQPRRDPPEQLEQRRSTVTAGRGLPITARRRPRAALHADPGQRRPRQQQPARPPVRHRGRRADRGWYRDLRRQERHDHAQPHRAQRRLGRRGVRLSGRGAASAGCRLPGRHAGGRRVPVPGDGELDHRQPFHGQRLLRQPRQWGSGLGARSFRPRELLPGQHRHRRHADLRPTEHRAAGWGTAHGHRSATPSLALQLLCASGMLDQCPPGSSYPQAGRVRMLPLPSQPTMADPCKGVPANPWCPASRSADQRPS